MEQLIELNNTIINGEEVNTVNARELHAFLGVRRDFTTWIKGRLDTLGSLEGQDYVILKGETLLTKTGEQNENLETRGGHNRAEYFITLDIAKHLAMMEKNEKGLQVRQYFIECEKQLLAKKDLTPKQSCFLYIAEASTQEQVLLGLNRLNNEVIVPLENKVAEQEEIIEESKPKVTYHDIVLNCPDLVTITQISQDYPISNQKLNKILAEAGVQYKDKSGVWCVYAKYGMNQYAQTSTHVYIDNSGKTHAKLHLKWTQKGRLFIYELLKSKGILPICEQEE